MSRTLSTEMQAVATADLVRPIYLVKMEFDSGDINLWSGLGNLIYDGDTYIGGGDLLDISSIKESEELEANGCNITISGVKQSLVALARDEPYQGRKITLFFGAFDDSGDIISDPVSIFSGFMDVLSITDSGDTSIINIACENKLIAFDRASVRRFTAEDQKIDYPDDKGFEFVSKINQKDIVWGRPNSRTSGGGSSRPRGGCFTKGTLILMSDNAYMAIEDLIVGDLVIGQEGQINTVTKIYHYPVEDRLLYTINDALVMTATHPIKTQKGWKSFDPKGTKLSHKEIKLEGKLAMGDVLSKYSPASHFYYEALETISKHKTLKPVYNLDVDGDDTFIANNFVVHNK